MTKLGRTSQEALFNITSKATFENNDKNKLYHLM